MQQKTEEVIYNGRIVDKKHFRVYIFGHEGQKKLVNNYDEYEAHLSTGVWFDSMTAIPHKSKISRKKPRNDEKLVTPSGTFEVTNAPDIEHT